MSKVSRRKFLGSAAVAAGAALALNGSAFGQNVGYGLFAIPKTAGDALSRLGWDSFLPFVNTDFDFYTAGRGGNSIALRLVDMKDSRPLRSIARSKGQENFVLKFTSYESLPLGDATYSVNHFNLGNFDLFVTNGGRNKRDGQQIIYTAVINRVTGTERSR